MQIDVQWSSLILGAVGCGLAGIGIWGYAYRLGFKHGRSAQVPFPLIDELLDHRISCLGQDPARARVAVETSLSAEEMDSSI
jgi:hypothetical protein